MALLDLEDLQQRYPQVIEVPHGYPKSVYAGILAGRPAPERIPMIRIGDRLHDDIVGPGQNVVAPRRGMGVLKQQQPGMRVPVCGACDSQIRFEPC